MDVAEIVREPEVALYRWTADEFMALLESGLIEEPRRIELLDGIIVTKMPPGDEHDFIFDALHVFFLTSGVYAQGMMPTSRVILRRSSVFEPDFVRFRPGVVGRYGAKREPDILWAVEVSVSSAAKDLGPKKRAYAEAGIPDYWVVDEGRRGIWVFSNPVEGAYASERFIPEGETIPLPELNAALDTSRLFPPKAV